VPVAAIAGAVVGVLLVGGAACLCLLRRRGWRWGSLGDSSSSQTPARGGGARKAAASRDVGPATPARLGMLGQTPMSVEPSFDRGDWSATELIPWHQCELLDRLGSGASGDVYRAEYASTDVACKVLRRKRAIDTREMQQLVEECRLALKLRHPNVLLALGLVSDGKSNHGILTELMDLTLDELIEGQANPAGRRPSWESPYLSVAYDVARGMAYLHQHRIIHRDLKPGNVLLKLPMMTAKVADFGASKDFVGDPGSDPTNGGGAGR